MSHIYNNLFHKSSLLALISVDYELVIMAYLLLPFLMDSYAKACEKIFCTNFDRGHFSYVGVRTEDVP